MKGASHARHARLQIAFLDASAKAVGASVRLVGPTYLQRQGVTRVEPRSNVAAVPAGARTARVILAGSRTGSGPCGFVDKVGLRVGYAPTGA